MVESRSPSRREFLKVGVAGAAGLAVAGVAPASPPLPLGKAKRCIFINLVGGPSHIDTFDPKPNAPSEIRGPFRPIQTNVPGLHLSELFPKLAGMADKFSLIRSMHHTAPPIHECGFQLLNTGRLFRDGPEWPCVGAVVSYLQGERYGPNLWGICPNATIRTGVNVSHGQGVGFLGEVIQPPIIKPWDVEFIRTPTASGWRMRHGLSDSVRFLTINMFDTVFDSESWDCHADGGSLRTDLNDIRDFVAPIFDTGFASILNSLEEDGLLESTLVVAMGEFGRTPRLNANGGRDHWAGAWTARRRRRRRRGRSRHRPHRRHRRRAHRPTRDAAGTGGDDLPRTWRPRRRHHPRTRWRPGRRLPRHAGSGIVFLDPGGQRRERFSL